MEITRRDFLKKSGMVAGIAALGSEVVPISRFVAEVEAAVLGGEAMIPSTCIMCVNFCGIRVSRVNGVIRQIYGNPESPYNVGHMCPKGQSGIYDAYNPYRIKAPLKRTNPNKGPGEDPKWKEISWEEAYSTIADKLKDIKADDPRKVVWLHGHGKYLVQDKFLKAFWKVYGTPNVTHRTTICEVARHVADELTWGYHAYLPDLDNCKYFLNFGANYFEAEQWARWLDRKTLDAMEKNGMKLVVIEPRLSNTAAKADEWIPIRPSTDAVFLLAMANELIANGYVDEEFLVTYTNAPNLVGSDGRFLRDSNGKELVWDRNSSSAKPYEGDVEPALTGSYTVDGKTYRTAFEVFKDEIKDITPEYAEGVCDVPADTIRRIAREFGEEANIGATIVKDGHVLRYRPVGIHTFRGITAHEYGTQNNRARLLVLMLVGAIEGVGSQILHEPYHKPQLMEPSKCEYPPNRVDLQQSVYFPHATHNVAQQVGLTLADPDAYGLPYKPEMMMSFGTNRVFSCSDIGKQVEGYKKLYHVHIDTILTEHANMADIVLPNKSYLEAWHWSYTRFTVRTRHDAIRQPVVNTYNLPYQDLEILMELAERVGILDGYIEKINSDWHTNLAPGRKYTAEEVVAAIAEAKGKSLEYFKEHGLSKKVLTTEQVYLEGIESKFKGAGNPKMHFYCEELVETADKVKEVVAANNIQNIDTTNLDVVYSPLPKKEHAVPTLHNENPSEYDLYLITNKRMYFNQTCNPLNPMLRHVAHDSDENYVLINTTTAAMKGIKDGDEVNVESRIATVKAKAKLTEGIRPDTVAISYHYGHWSTDLPSYAKKGVNPNWVMDVSTPDRISGMNAFNDNKVKVYK